MGETYSTLVVQPIDLIRAFKVDFCLASVIKWLTKWHMEKKTEYLTRAKYYVNLCESNYSYSSELLFGLRMYCILNGFMKDNSSTCLLLSVVQDVMEGKLDDATWKIRCAWADDEQN